MIASTRRAALGAIFAAPLASMPAAAASVSTELVRLIAEHDRLNAVLDKFYEDDRIPNKPAIHAAGLARARVTGFRSRGLADILAKAACLARMYPLADLEFEVREQVETGSVHLECMAEGIAVELMRFGEDTLCA